MQSDTAVIKCAQCGAQLIVPDCSEYVDEYRVRHIWKCEPCGYAFEATIASRRREPNCESYVPGPHSPQERKSVSTVSMPADG